MELVSIVEVSIVEVAVVVVEVAIVLLLLEDLLFKFFLDGDDNFNLGDDPFCLGIGAFISIFFLLLDDGVMLKFRFLGDDDLGIGPRNRDEEEEDDDDGVGPDLDLGIEDFMVLLVGDNRFNFDFGFLDMGALRSKEEEGEDESVALVDGRDDCRRGIENPLLIMFLFVLVVVVLLVLPLVLPLVPFVLEVLVGWECDVELDNCDCGGGRLGGMVR